MKVLDLFAGTGSATEAFKDRGHEVITVDMDELFSPDIVADVRHLPVKGYFDFIWASPPCTEFAKYQMAAWYEQPRLPDLSLIHAVLMAVDRLKPRWWVLENSRGLRYVLGEPTKRCGTFYLWGDFPIFYTERFTKGTDYVRDPRTRAMIPYDLSLALCIACESHSLSSIGE